MTPYCKVKYKINSHHFSSAHMRYSFKTKAIFSTKKTKETFFNQNANSLFYTKTQD